MLRLGEVGLSDVGKKRQQVGGQSSGQAAFKCKRRRRLLSDECRCPDGGHGAGGTLGGALRDGGSDHSPHTAAIWSSDRKKGKRWSHVHQRAHE